MPQWVQLPPNLLPEKHTLGRSIYSTDYSSKRPGFQIHLQKRRGTHRSHHPHPPKDPDRKTMRARQTGDYMSFRADLERALAATENTKLPGKRPGIASPKTHSNSGVPEKSKGIQDFLKSSLNTVQQSWMEEAQAVKRDRDRAYGLAGKRLDLQKKAGRKETNPTELPGLNKWLQSSNEYEKAVVHNFINTISKTTTGHRPTRKTEVPTEKGTSKARFANEYYYKRRAKSACSHRPTDRSQPPPRPHSVEGTRHEDEAEAEESEGEDQGVEFTPGHPHHTEGNCEFCDYMRVKKLLEDLNRLGPSGMGETSISHLLRTRVGNPHPTHEDYDYIHDNSFFTNTTARNRGYFIIAPDWVSERKGIPPPRYRYY